MLQIGLDKIYGTCHVDSLTSTSASSVPLTFPIQLSAPKEEDGLPHSEEGSPLQTLQDGDRCVVNADHKVDSIGLIPALVDPPFPGVKSPIQPMDPHQYRSVSSTGPRNQANTLL
jgi:hypothetical protein